MRYTSLLTLFPCDDVLDRAMAREGHDLLDAEALLDPEADREVPEIVPAHLDVETPAERLEVPFENVRLGLDRPALGREHELER